MQIVVVVVNALISIHALLAESDSLAVTTVEGGSDISIHALLAESDSQKHINRRSDHIISIHALLAESDPQAIYPCETPPKFLSTLSLRRATNSGTQADPAKSISIHALLAESDAGPNA